MPGVTSVTRGWRWFREIELESVFFIYWWFFHLPLNYYFSSFFLSHYWICFHGNTSSTQNPETTKWFSERHQIDWYCSFSNNCPSWLPNTVAHFPPTRRQAFAKSVRLLSMHWFDKRERLILALKHTLEASIAATLIFGDLWGLSSSPDLNYLYVFKIKIVSKCISVWFFFLFILCFLIHEASMGPLLDPLLAFGAEENVETPRLSNGCSGKGWRKSWTGTRIVSARRFQFFSWICNRTIIA